MIQIVKWGEEAEDMVENNMVNLKQKCLNLLFITVKKKKKEALVFLKSEIYEYIIKSHSYHLR